MSATPDKYILLARGLNKSYTQRSGRFGFGSTKVKALDEVNISLRAGSTLAVVGESGSGKSTLARCLLQLQPLDSGEVIFQGNNLAGLSGSALRQERRHLQMIFQDPFASLNPRMKVRDIVAEGLVIHEIGTAKEQQDKVVQMLERVGLSAADMNKYPHQFSGGQRQRIGIARALVLQPKVVVCDEPTSITDAYALIKLLSREYGVFRFKVVANMVRSLREGQELFSKLTRVTDRFLDASLELVACIPYDNNVRQAVKKQKVIVDAFPKSPASLAFRALANKAAGWPTPHQPGGHLEFFIETLLHKPSLAQDTISE